VPDSFAYIVVHDGARPLAGPELFHRTLDLLDASPELAGAVVGHPSVDTLKTVEAGRVAGTPERSRYWTVQTPQAFRAGALRVAYAEAAEYGREGTDDASLVEAAGGAIGLVEGPRDNIKVTLAEDLAVAEALLSVRAEGSA
jgi:2-C-methyl-D-erythritol 4-phosphate cytidylyltransferase